MNKIAIIGMACCFPQSTDIETFWKNLQQGKDCITHFSPKQSFLNKTEAKKTIQARGILKESEIECFDYPYFGISHQEASMMDPQHRLFLEKCVESLENAGCDLARYGGRVGVFASAAESTYLRHYLLANQEFSNSHFPYRTQLMTSPGFLATRVSYLLNLKGPSVNINTACSSSLVNIIYACQAIQNDECDLALAGGVTIHCPQDHPPVYYPGSILSPEGICRPFDQDALGTVSSNGVGVIILKRLTDALKEKDNILALISGFGINNDGASKISYAAPSVKQQTQCVLRAMKMANIDSRQISYIETHGTATRLGDEVEIMALKQAFSGCEEKKDICALGAVKSNIGHTDMASGVAGVIKTVLSMIHQQIVPTIHHHSPNPILALEQSPFYVNTSLKSWDLSFHQKKRVAGVNSLGIGGTNAHLILEEFPITKTKASCNKPYYIVPLSAPTPSAFMQYRKRLQEPLKDSTSPVADVAYTLALGRSPRSFRKAYVCHDLPSFSQQLSTDQKISQHEQDPHFAFILDGSPFTLSDTMMTFFTKDCGFLKNHVDHCLNYLSKDLTNHWHQDALLTYFIVQYAYVKTLIDFGIQPKIALVSGWGIYVAYTIFGKISLKNFLKIFCQHQASGHRNTLDITQIHLSMAPYLIPQALKLPIFLLKTAGQVGIYNNPTIQKLTKQCRLKKIHHFIAFHIKDNFYLKITQHITRQKNLIVTWPSLSPKLNTLPNLWHNLDKTLAHCWEQGVNISWEHYFHNESRKKISLPPCVFDKQRAWIEPSKNDQTRIAIKSGTSHHLGAPYWELLVEHKELRLTQIATWLVFAGKDPFSEAIITFLKKHHQRIVILRKNKDDLNLKEGDHFDPSIVSECLEVRQSVATQVNHIDYVLYLWPLDSPCHNEVLLIKNIVTLILSPLPQEHWSIYFFVKHSVRLNHQDIIDPTHAMLYGMSLVLSQEFSLRSTVIDLETKTRYPQTLVANILSQGTKAPEHALLACRSKKLFIRRVKPWIIEYSKPNSIKNECSVLITGGLGKIGLSIAKHFANHYHAHILLIAHTANHRLKPRHIYTLEEYKREGVHSVIDKLKFIQSHARCLSIAFADVACYNDLHHLIELFLKNHPSLDYVIHLAAYLKHDAKHPIHEMDEKKLHEQMRPKLDGYKNIHRLSQIVPMGTVVAFSSLSSFIGGVSMSTYASVNAALDAYFQSIDHKTPVQWFCLNWDAWAWQSEHDESKELPLKKIDSSLRENQAIQYLIDILTCQYEKPIQLLITAYDIVERLHHISSKKAKLPDLPKHQAHKQTFDIKHSLRHIFSQCLGDNNIQDHENFFDLGGDSLSTIELIDQIEKAFSVTLTHSFIAQNPTIDDLYKRLREKMRVNKQPIYRICPSEGKNIFLFHPVSGMNTCYLHLAKYLAPEYACFVIEDPEIEARKILFHTLEDRIDHYFDLINTVQSQGSYIFMGYSFGGTIAHSLTQRLEQKGNPHSSLFIIDGWAAFSRELKSYARFQCAMQRHVNEMLGRITDPSIEKTLMNLLWHRMQSLFTYQLPTIDSDIILLKAEKILDEYHEIDHRFNHWNDYTRGQIEVYSLPFTHNTLLNSKASHEVANIIKTTLSIRKKPHESHK